MYFFFFQAEDGIRDIGVTGVQTCALPISPLSRLAPDTDGKARQIVRMQNVRRLGIQRTSHTSRHGGVVEIPQVPGGPFRRTGNEAGVRPVPILERQPIYRYAVDDAAAVTAGFSKG